MSKRNPLVDADFLKQLDTERQREVFAKVIALDWDENPTEEITGRVTGGSISIDGSSAVRRTCSLTMVAEEMNIHDYYWGLNTKFKLSVGLRNTIDSKYPDIIWFPQGTYAISSFSTSQATNNYTINLQGKDKMCLLNGELGGVVNSLTWDFGSYDEISADGTIKNKKYLLKDIIVEAVHEFAKEPYHNIVVNDLDECGVELIEYRGKTTMYLLYNQTTLEVTQMTQDGSATYPQYKRLKSKNWITSPIALNQLNTIDNLEDEGYDTRTDRLSVDTNPILLKSANGTEYTVMKAEYGDVVGYRVTDLTYAGDLIAQVGNPITSAVLDKIKSMLGEFEYFYDLDGRFIFQRKKTHISSTYNGIQQNEDEQQWFDNVAETSSVTYFFEDAQIITSFNNQPQLANLKNDFSIWGVRKSVSGNEIPVHMRYAIDRKPIYYKNYDGIVYTTDLTVLDAEKESMKQDILNSLNERLERYQPEYGVAISDLQSPTKLSDGSWTPGWWDIRDWDEYYYILKGEYPNGTMKWYSQNDASGAIPINSIHRFSMTENYKDRWCWLIIYDPREDFFNFQHGSGSPSSQGYDCTYYESHLDSSGKVVTKTVPGVPRKKFIPPFCGCSDNHTFLEFLKGDIEADGNLVYFYNPAFPDAVSFDEVVKDQVDREYEDAVNSGRIKLVYDWREIIYQMAKDNMSHGHKDSFLSRVAANNFNYYPTGQTGYEQYYTDIISFWRDIYNPSYLNNFEEKKITLKTFNTNPTNYYKAVRCTENTPYENGNWLKRTGVNQKFDSVDMTETIWNTKLLPKERTYYYILKQCANGDVFDSKSSYFIKNTDAFIINNDNPAVVGWSKEVAEFPEMLNFWFDFLDAKDGDLDKYSVQNVGIRPKAENDTNVKAIYFRDTPNVIFVDTTKIEEESKSWLIEQYGSEQEWRLAINNRLTRNDKIYYLEEMLKLTYPSGATAEEIEAQRDEAIANLTQENIDSLVTIFQEQELQEAVDENIRKQKEEKTGYTFIRLPKYMENQFTISAQGKSAFDKLDNWLYTYACCTESISISALPVYYLSPNTRIFVKDVNSGIEGEYIVNRISLPLTYNGMMSITATKAVQRLY